jgi:hypothetical protein
MTAIDFFRLAAGWTLLCAALAWTLREAAGERTTRFGAAWWLLCAATILAFRWPVLGIAHELNPDESQLLAGAITLRQDPVFWRSVDGATAGPLDFYVLLPTAWAHGPASYIVAHMLAFICEWGALVLAGLAMAAVASVTVARAAMLPAVAFHSFTQAADFTHFSTEQMPALLLSGGACAAAHAWNSWRPREIWITAILLGCVPLAKLQATPLAAALWFALAMSALTAGQRRLIGPLLIGALLPMLVFGGIISLAGQAEHAAISYLFSNFAYVQSHTLPHSDALLYALRFAVADGFLGAWLIGGTIFAFVAIVAGRRGSPRLRQTAVAAAGFLLLALICVVIPRRPFAHYLRLLFLPLGLVTAVAIASGEGALARVRAEHRIFVVAVFLACTLGPQVALRIAGHEPNPWLLVARPNPSLAYGRLEEGIASFARPGEPLAVWGWRSSLYVFTGLPQATRQAHTEMQLKRGVWQRYFLRRYFEDFCAANPPVFVDAVGPGNFRFEDRAQAHESFPLLRDLIKARYTFVSEIAGTRVFVRNDRFAEKGIRRADAAPQ